MPFTGRYHSATRCSLPLPVAGSLTGPGTGGSPVEKVEVRPGVEPHTGAFVAFDAPVARAGAPLKRAGDTQLTKIVLCDHRNGGPDRFLDLMPAVDGALRILSISSAEVSV